MNSFKFWKIMLKEKKREERRNRCGRHQWLPTHSNCPLPPGQQSPSFVPSPPSTHMLWGKLDPKTGLSKLREPHVSMPVIGWDVGIGPSFANGAQQKFCRGLLAKVFSTFLFSCLWTSHITVYEDTMVETASATLGPPRAKIEDKCQTVRLAKRKRIWVFH